MRLHTIKPARGAKRAKTRVGRGIGSGIGKTCGLGHKGQRARAGGYHKVGFEGGQSPLQRRLPKFGFRSAHKDEVGEVRLDALKKVKAERIDIKALRDAQLIAPCARRVKVIASGKLEGPVTLVGLSVTRGARAAIAAAGGTVEA